MQEAADPCTNCIARIMKCDLECDEQKVHPTTLETFALKCGNTGLLATGIRQSRGYLKL